MNPPQTLASRRSRPTPRVLPALLWLLACGVAGAQVRPDGPSLFRVFLRDGTAVVSYGDFARVGDRLVFTMPVGTGTGAGQLQAVNLPISSVDLDKTEQYALGVRAERYAATSGEADYAALTAAVATALNKVTSTNEPIERLQIAEQVRGIVATWGRDHYGYRAEDVRQIQALLDELVSDLRADAGINQFDLNLVAGVAPPPVMTMPAPTPAEAIEQVLRVAKTSDVAADRLALLNAAVRALEKPVPGATADWVNRTRESIDDLIAAEIRTDRAYRDLARTMMARALEAASRADGPAVEEVLDDIRAADQRLGGRRPDEVAALTARVRGDLEAARRLRLARDHWRLQSPALRQYEEMIRSPLQQLVRASKSLDAIRRLSGPDPDVLQALGERLTRAGQLIARVSPPSDVAEVHATLTSACQLAQQSVGTRLRAVQSGDLQLAWDASSAAAGAMMLVARARDQLQAALRLPELQ